MSAFPLYKTEERQDFIGFFYENLVRHLTHSKPIDFEEWSSQKNGGHFDFCNEEIRSFIEVKGGSNMDQIKLFSCQLDSQIKELGFPFDDGFTWIFSYRNRENNGERSRLLKSQGKDSDSLSKFLSENTLTSFVVYTGLLEVIKEKYGVKPYTRDKYRDRNLLNINRILLKEISANLRDVFVKLGYSDELPRWIPKWANKIPSRMVKTTLDGQEINFELTILLPNKLKMRLLKQMNGSVSIKK